MQFVNEPFLRLFGYRKGELEGSNVARIMPNPFSAQHDCELGLAVVQSLMLLCALHVCPDWESSEMVAQEACRLPWSASSPAAYLRNYATSRVPRILDTGEPLWLGW